MDIDSDDSSSDGENTSKEPAIMRLKNKNLPKAAYECIICCQLFTNKPNFKRHLKEHATEDNGDMNSAPAQMYGGGDMGPMTVVNMDSLTVRRGGDVASTKTQNWANVIEGDAGDGGLVLNGSVVKEEMNECIMCPFKCVDAELFMAHMRTHTGEKPQVVDF